MDGKEKNATKVYTTVVLAVQTPGQNIHAEEDIDMDATRVSVGAHAALVANGAGLDHMENINIIGARPTRIARVRRSMMENAGAHAPSDKLQRFLRKSKRRTMGQNCKNRLVGPSADCRVGFRPTIKLAFGRL